jgi:two-component system, chemotaxis family, chemotaxis protein CheY
MTASVNYSFFNLAGADFVPGFADTQPLLQLLVKDMPDAQSARYVDGAEPAPQLGGALQTVDRLLVIDDDVPTCTMLAKIGEAVGFSVRRAVSLEQAADLLRTEHFACITLDLGLGKNSGVEVLNILAKMACTAPIIIISASMRSMRDFAAEIGNTMHLDIRPPIGKPIDFAQLKTTLAGIKQKLSMQRETISAG